MKWIRDEAYIRGTTPMTKFEIRSISLAMLEVEPHEVLLDIGAGTGSVSIQAALLGAQVYAIEMSDEGCSLTRQNASLFEVEMHLIQGIAPEAMKQVPDFNKCFIGGSHGQLQAIMETVDQRLASGGQVVANFIRLENLLLFKKFLEQQDYQNIETRMIQVSLMDSMGMMRAQNPVVIIGAKKA
ncbi:precorrin-6Y C5,15-methyltransferase (decarboxylating) subunit CbiT [Deltaproteobacteria bacterium TL4]